MRDTLTRRLTHEPLGWHPTTLLVTVRRHRCPDCGHVWRQDTTVAADPRAKILRGGLCRALARLVCQHLSVARVAEGLGVAWNTVNDAFPTEGQRLLIGGPLRFYGVRVVAVDEHVWGHTGWREKYVAVLMDLTAVRDGTGSARLLDMVPCAQNRRSGSVSPPDQPPGMLASRSSRWTRSPATRQRPLDICPARWP